MVLLWVAAPWLLVHGALQGSALSQYFPVVVLCAAGCCAQAVWGWAFRVAWRPGLGRAWGFGMGRRGCCRAWAGAGASGW